MSHQQKVRGAGGADLDEQARAIAQQPVEEQLSNEFLASLLETAADQAGLDAQTSILSIAAEELDGQYHFPEDVDESRVFPEDGERKKQEQELPKLRESHAGTYNYEDFTKGAAFVQGEGDAQAVDPNDVAQGSLGDCYLIAAMVAVARANPQAIADRIHDNGDGTFDVTLHVRESRYGKPKPIKTTIDAQLPVKREGVPLYAKTGDSGADQTELWPALLEKAVAQQKGSYDKISGGNIATDFQFHGATELLTGKAEGYKATKGMSEDDALLEMAAALEGKKPITVDSLDMSADEAMTREATAKNVYGNHAYAPLSVDLDARTVTLTNPWGTQHVLELPIAEFLKYYRGIRIGS